MVSELGNEVPVHRLDLPVEVIGAPDETQHRVLPKQPLYVTTHHPPPTQARTTHHAPKHHPIAAARCAHSPDGSRRRHKCTCTCLLCATQHNSHWQQVGVLPQALEQQQPLTRPVTPSLGAAASDTSCHAHGVHMLHAVLVRARIPHPMPAMCARVCVCMHPCARVCWSTHGYTHRYQRGGLLQTPPSNFCG